MASNPHNAKPDELARLIDRHGPALVLLARQWCICGSDSAEDAVQEAIIKLAGLATWPNDPVAWLYVAVRNQARSRTRGEQRRKRHEHQAGQQRPAWFIASPEDRLDATAAAQAIQELDADQREIVVARIWGGLTFQQIAQLCGISDSAAHRRYEAALVFIRERLQACPKTNDPQTS